MRETSFRVDRALCVDFEGFWAQNFLALPLSGRFQTELAKVQIEKHEIQLAEWNSESRI